MSAKNVPRLYMENTKSTEKIIVIAGGTGLIGRHLTNVLLSSGYRVRILSRKSQASNEPRLEYHEWNPDQLEINAAVLSDAYGIINLAGASIAKKRWTGQYKQQIINSRVNATKTLVSALETLTSRPEIFINASATGYYGTQHPDARHEESGAGNDFLSQVCVAWEKEAQKAKNVANRLMILRIGVVLSTKDGALKQIATPVKYGFGAPLGSGKQEIPWIHIEDLVQALKWGLENNVAGVYNGNTDNTTNKALTKAIATSLRRKLWSPNVPGFVLRILLGQMAEIALKGQKIANKKLLDEGFQPKFNELQKAVDHLISNKF